MSISWDVLEGIPTTPPTLLTRTLDNLKLLTGYDGWRIAASGQADGDPWTWSGTEPAAASPRIMEWEAEVVATWGNHAGQVRISSIQETEDDGSPVEGRASLEVLAHRTQTSTVLGLAAGLAAYAVSGGELSGPGLDRWHKPHEVEAVFERFARLGQNHADIEDAIRALGAVSGVSILSLW